MTTDNVFDDIRPTAAPTDDDPEPAPAERDIGGSKGVRIDVE